jgi:hypothetical protein
LEEGGEREREREKEREKERERFCLAQPVSGQWVSCPCLLRLGAKHSPLTRILFTELLEIKPKALFMLGKGSTTKLHSQYLFYLFIYLFIYLF